MPYKQRNSSNYSVNCAYKGIGRIQKSTGSNSLKTAKAMEAMLDRLYSSGKGNLLEGLQRGDVSLPWLFGKYSAGELDTHISTATLEPFSQIIKWVENNPDFAKGTKSSYSSLARKVERLYPNSTTHKMPKMLRDFRAYCLDPKIGIRRGFNQTRTLFQAYATHIDGKYKPLWTEITNVPPLPYEMDIGKKLTYPEARELSKKLFRPEKPNAEAHIRVLWTLLLTGFRKSEYLGEWQVFDDRVVVKSAKRRHSGIAKRTVPLLTHEIPGLFVMGDVQFAKFSDLSFSHKCPFDPGTGYQEFERHLRRATGKTYSAHDFRHTARSWMKLAGIELSRAEQYIGHKLNPKNVVDLYSGHAVEPYLKSDAALMGAWLAAQEDDYQANYNSSSAEFLNDGAAMYDDGPVLLYSKTPQKRAPRPVRQPSDARVETHA